MKFSHAITAVAALSPVLAAPVANGALVDDGIKASATYSERVKTGTMQWKDDFMNKKEFRAKVICNTFCYGSLVQFMWKGCTNTCNKRMGGTINPALPTDPAPNAQIANALDNAIESSTVAPGAAAASTVGFWGRHAPAFMGGADPATIKAADEAALASKAAAAPTVGTWGRYAPAIMGGADPATIRAADEAALAAKTKVDDVPTPNAAGAQVNDVVPPAPVARVDSLPAANPNQQNLAAST
jgi:hypothetical protein